MFRFLFSMAKLGCLLVVLGIVGIFILRQFSPGPSPSPPPQAPGGYPPPPGAYPAPPSAPSPGRPVVDLAIVGAQGTWQQGQRYFAVTTDNRGPAMAVVVHADCSYRCASTGVTANSVQLFRNGQLAPGQSLRQILPVMPCPDTAFQLSCIVYAGVPVQEIDLNNNQWTGVVRF